MSFLVLQQMLGFCQDSQELNLFLVLNCLKLTSSISLMVWFDLLLSLYSHGSFNWYLETQNGFRFSPLFCRRKPEEVCWIWRKIQVISPAQGAPWTIQVESRKVIFLSIFFWFRMIPRVWMSFRHLIRGDFIYV